MEKPHTGLNECQRILLSRFRARNSASLENGLQGPQAPVVVLLLGEDPVCQDEDAGELLAQAPWIPESLRVQDDLGDDLVVGPGHGDRPEQLEAIV